MKNWHFYKYAFHLSAALGLLFFCTGTLLRAQTNCPDLIVRSLRVLSYDGANIRYAYTIQNVGTAPANLNTGNGVVAGNVGIQAMVSKDTVFEENIDLAAGWTVLGVNLPILAVGDTFSGTFQGFQRFNPRVYPFLTIKVDQGNRLVECNEQNNFLYTTTQGFFSGIDTNSCQYKDSLALLDLYNSTDGANWTNKWEIGFPMNTWFGVQLNAQGCVTCLDLDGLPDCTGRNEPNGNNLKGSIPNLNLPDLTSLLLSNNKLSGSIPNFSLGKLKVLHLMNNSLSGTIPSFNLPNLEELLLSFNQLSGTIPNFNLPKLRGLLLSNNRISGSIPNFDMPELVSLFLSSNLLTGGIPNFSTPRLQLMYLNNNQLNGPIPEFNLPELRFVLLHNNKLSGPIPRFNSPGLITLWLSVNQLSGPIPNFDLPNLVLLRLDNNRLEGRVPALVLPSLEELDVSFNQLEGALPILTLPKLKSLDLRNNRLSSLPALTYLQLRPDSVIQRGLRVANNQLTFQSILPNLGFVRSATFVYAPQNQIFRDTSIVFTPGQALRIDLGIDSGIVDNRYDWFKNNQPYRVINGNNQLDFATTQAADTGVYTVQVTNPQAPTLILRSKSIKLVAEKVTVCQDTTLEVSTVICQGQSFRFGDSLLVRGGTYRRTFKTALGCDSTVVLKLTVEQPIIQITGDTTLCPGDTTALVATGGKNYRWSTGSRDSLLIISQPGAYTVWASTINACQTSRTVIVLQDTLPQLEISGKTTVCPEMSTLIGVTGADRYRWNTGDTLSSLDLKAGNYTIRAQNASGCVAEASVEIITLPRPRKANDQTWLVCSNELPKILVKTAAWETLDWFAEPQGGTALDTTTNVFQVNQVGNLYAQVRNRITGCVAAERTQIRVQKDSIKPQFVYCPDTIVTYLNPGIDSVSVAWETPIAEDNCGEVVLKPLGPEPGSFFPLGQHTISYVAIDQQQNADTCSFVIQVQATHPLTFWIDSTAAKRIKDSVYSVPVRVLNFKAVKGWQFTLAFRGNPGKIVKVENLGILPDSISSFIVNDSTLTLVWNGQGSGSGINLPDSTAILQIQLLIAGGPGTCSSLEFVENPTQIWAVLGPQIGVHPTTRNARVCRPAFVDITGRILREDSIALVEHEVLCADTSVFTDKNGFFLLPKMRPERDYILTPQNNRRPNQGVNVIDIALIREHILLRKELESPYKIIAADVDGSKGVNVLDISFLREVALLKRTAFPNNVPSWRYVPQLYVFQNPRRPLAEPFPENITLPDIQEDTSANFIGIKVGDVDLSARVDLRAASSLDLLIQDQQFSSGETLSIPVRAADLQDITAFQFDVFFDPAAIDIIGLEAADLSNLDSNALAWEDKERGVVSLLWIKALQESIQSSYRNNPVLFQLQVRTKQHGLLSDVLHFGSKRIDALATNGNGDFFQIQPHYNAQITTGSQFQATPKKLQLIKVYPNPFRTAVSIEAEADRSEVLSLSIFNSTGQVVFSQMLTSQVGRNTWNLDAPRMLPSKGLYFFCLRGSQATINGKLCYE